jgi:excinuclease UvrABC ATPase subunit
MENLHETDQRVEAEKITKELQESNELNTIESMIKDNKIEFMYNAKKYRVRLLTTAEKCELDNLRTKKFTQLLKDKDVLFEKELIKLYKERGIEIDLLDDTLKQLDAEESNVMMKLGESLHNQDGDAILKSYAEQIERIKFKRQMTNNQRNSLLEFSLENKLLQYVAEIITYLSLDVEENTEWKRVFKSYEEFRNYIGDELVIKSGMYSMFLQYL